MEEDRREHERLDILKEEWLEYVGSIAPGLNDALAGPTFALQDATLIALKAAIYTGAAHSFGYLVRIFLGVEV